MADIIAVNGTRYYNANQLREQDPVYFHGTSRSVRKIIEKKKIPQSEYIYASHSKKKGWTAAIDQNNPSPKATLLLSVQWINQNMNQNMDPDDPIEAPAIMMLTDEEKFHDEYGNVMDIETRGKRQHDKAYFLVNDVSKVFNMPNLHSSISHKDRGYNINEDYKTFICNDDATTNAAPTKRLFLTYEGMIKVLYSSRSGSAKSFRTWATKTLFTIQMGKDSDKEELASAIIGVPAKSLRQVLKSSTCHVPCVYAFVLGTVETLRATMNIAPTIPDTSLVIKYGETDNLCRRTSEHMKEYGTIPGVKLELLMYCYVDPKYISEAEVYLKDFFGDVETFVKYKSYTELVTLNLTHKRQLKQTFDNIQCKYSGCVKGLIQEVETLKQTIKYLKESHQWALKNEKAEHAITKQTVHTRDVQVENLQLKLELAEIKYKQNVGN